MRKSKLLVYLLILSFSLVFTGSVMAKDKVDIAYVEWDCAVASTNLVKAVLQEKMGYEVDTTPVTAAAMWQAVATGDVEAMVTAWLPVTHADYMEKSKADVEDLGVIVGGAKLGWAVPSYVDVDSIAELNENAGKFDGEIIGIDPGAGLMRLSEKTIDEYNLSNFELVEGSGATMTAALQNAIKNNEPVVVTAWSPHWMFGKWDLKYLEDPKGTLGEEETIHAIVRDDLKQDMPKVYAFLDNFSYESPEQLQKLMAWNQEPGTTPYENAVRFMEEHPELVQKWLP